MNQKTIDIPELKRRAAQPHWYRYIRQYSHYAWFFFQKVHRSKWREFPASARRAVNNYLMMEEALAKANNQQEHNKILQGLMQQAANSFIDQGQK